MRKFSVRFAILCILVLLIGVTALAISGSVSNLKNQDANVVEVKLNSGNSGEDPTFSITRKNAEDGKLYTVLIRSGAEDENPSGGDDGNLVYMDIVEATNGVVSVTKAYPKEMTTGTYRVFMSDYAKNAVTQVATFEVGNPNPGGGTENPDDVKLGDVNGDEDITPHDASLALQIYTHILTSYTTEQYTAADVNRDGDVTPHDASLILQKYAHVISEFPN